MKLRKNGGVKFKITTTSIHRGYNSPFNRGVYLGSGFQLSHKHQHRIMITGAMK